MEEVDAVVIGAGPAGLAAASALRSKSSVDVRVVEFGRLLNDRVRLAPEDAASGVGGAGLFSDGKFSFFPSATSLWSLLPRDALVESYDWYRSLLADLPWADLVPGLPEHSELVNLGAVPPTVIDKSYPSYYTTLVQREVLTAALADSLGPELLTSTDVDEISVDGDGATVVARDRASGRAIEFECRVIVIATGRLGPLDLARLLPTSPWRAGRIEVGVRLEQPTDSFILAAHPSVDPKLIVSQHDGGSVRTFCCCRNGEIVVTDSRGIITVSGRADVKPTGYSNIGVVLRPGGKMLHEDPSLLDRVTDVGSHLRCDVGRFFSASSSEDLVAVLGRGVVTRIRDSVRQVCDVVGVRMPTAGTIHGVAIEGVGSYPDLRPDLRWGSGPVWVAGDATGLFRGITAAFVSGYFAGERARMYLTTLPRP